jgi:DNA repair protein RadC
MKKTVDYLNEIVISYNKKLLNNSAVNTSENAVIMAREIFRQTDSNPDLKEYFFVLMFNSGNLTIGFLKVSEGGISGTVVDNRLIFATALKCLATGLILVHNHPSGVLKPSSQDIEATTKIKSAAKLFDLRLLDHIILSSDSYFSFSDEGIL